ncbi:MAG: ABC transporter permease [Salinigranum sp.]
MFDITRYESRRRVRGTLALAALIGLFTLLIVGIYPSIAASGTDFQAYIESLPPALRESFGVSAITTVEGFLSTELYQFIWLLLFGLYMAYLGGGAVAGDVESGRIELVLATPVSRSRLLAETYLSLLVPVVALNLLVPLFVYGGLILIDESVDLTNLIAVHVLSVPYLLVCASVGVLLSVLVSREDAARRGGIAAIFMLFVIDAVSAGTDYDWLGALSPTRYYDPTDILVHGTYDVGGALVLLAAALALLAASQAIFRRADL